MTGFLCLLSSLQQNWNAAGYGFWIAWGINVPHHPAHWQGSKWQDASLPLAIAAPAGLANALAALGCSAVEVVSKQQCLSVPVTDAVDAVCCWPYS